MAGLLVVVALALASCAGPTGSGADSQDGDETRASHQTGNKTGDEKTGDGMADGDHSEMDHGSVGGEEMARQMIVDENGAYSDERFIDAMVPYHQGAVEMAVVALRQSGREEILQLSRDILRTQEIEIQELKDIKLEEFGTAEVPMGMNEGDMEMMGMVDSEELGQQRPFDRAFIDAMIPHHQSAIDMANVSLQESDNPRIRELAAEIVEAQKREIAQMEQWREEWYPEG